MAEKHCLSVRADFEQAEYEQAVRRMMDYMVAGDIYVANMTQQFEIHSTKSPVDVFLSLRKNNPSPFGAYMNCKDFQIISASPERFVHIRNGIIETRPIKGTRKRGTNAAEDQLLWQELQQSKKDRSELLMIVDLERNDLNRICLPGSVVVPEMFAIEAYATVFHLVSTVRGQVNPNVSFSDILRAVFPAVLSPVRPNTVQWKSLTNWSAAIGIFTRERLAIFPSMEIVTGILSFAPLCIQTTPIISALAAESRRNPIRHSNMRKHCKKHALC